MIRADYIDHGRSSCAIIMTTGRKLHCERETGGHHHLKKTTGSQTPDGKIPNGSVTPDIDRAVGNTYHSSRHPAHSTSFFVFKEGQQFSSWVTHP